LFGEFHQAFEMVSQVRDSRRKQLREEDHSRRRLLW
jgi:hypothetical protein